jgi:hypothetical protein
MNFNKKEINLLKKIQNLTKNFKNEISECLNIRDMKFTFTHLGNENSVGYEEAQLTFHTHPPNDGWKYGGPPSYQDYKIIFSNIQSTEYIINQKFVYRFTEYDNEDVDLRKLEENISYYIRLGGYLENGEISIKCFKSEVLDAFDIKIDVIELC